MLFRVGVKFCIVLSCYVVCWFVVVVCVVGKCCCVCLVCVGVG